jgi:hypothetical protein
VEHEEAGSRATRSATHPSGVWAIRYVCGAGHTHKEKVGRLKSEAVDRHHERRQRARHEPGWCPALERRQREAQATADREREARRVTFREYAGDYLEWAKRHKRSWPKDESRLNSALLPALGARHLDGITTAEIEALPTT